MDNFTVIAEIGCSHGGSLERAKTLAKLAKLSGAHVVKTQKRNPKESTKKELWDQPHPNKIYAYGDTYLQHRENLELTIKQHIELKKYCEDINIDYSTSVWDMTSTKEVVSLNPKFIKIPSACNHRNDMIDYLLKQYKGQIHISTGMLNEDERGPLYLKLAPHKNKIVIYHCTSGYPVPFNKLYLNEIKDMTKLFPHVGFSNHGYGIAMAPVCYALGARYFEYHFIDDRLYRHTDSSNSLEPQGMSKLVRNIKAISQALNYKPDKLDEIEKEQRDKLRT